MANKPARRSWNDIQVAIAVISMTLTLAFWNLFAGPDRESAIKRAQDQAALPPSEPIQTVEPAVLQPTPLGDGKILFGGSAPQTQIIIQSGGGGGGRGGGGGAVTSTGSS